MATTLDGMYSMLTQGWERVNGGYEPMAALAAVTFSPDSESGGKIEGKGVLRFLNSNLLLAGSEPFPVKEFTILPGSRYWLSELSDSSGLTGLTGRAVFHYRLYNQATTILHYYFTVEEGNTMSFVVTEARYYPPPVLIEGLPPAAGLVEGPPPPLSNVVMFGTLKLMQPKIRI